MRAADVWESARFTGIFLASSLYWSQTESSLRPPAANANRWAQEENTRNSLAGHAVLRQLSRPPRAARCKMKSTPSYSGGASSASWRNHSFLACQQSNCGAIVPVVQNVRRGEQCHSESRLVSSAANASGEQVQR